MSSENVNWMDTTQHQTPPDARQTLSAVTPPEPSRRPSHGQIDGNDADWFHLLSWSGDGHRWEAYMAPEPHRVHCELWSVPDDGPPRLRAVFTHPWEWTYLPDEVVDSAAGFDKPARWNPLWVKAEMREHWDALA